MQYKAGEKGIELTNRCCDPKLSSVLIGDPDRINQIILNVISNAIKFTEISSVDVSCHVLKEDDNSQYLEIKITDTGIGLDALCIQKIFKKFTQEHEAKGRGLGMASTKTLADHMRGKTLVMSEINKGATISVMFYLEKGKAYNLKKKKYIAVTSKDLKGKKYLLLMIIESLEW
ncbi:MULTISPECIES: sensor histidine kinase [unclassified Polaribacter]|uniref:sensor histidine kinase n=1 Tax=unclassified Polaribacter TaxID=196858 RepID=UPI0011C308EA|nr:MULTISPECIES: ATP-binding protein [unclassified Polaribacter]TXD57909.1 hypothetical protein ES044_13895 [Polaribacter sp. IC066]